MHKCWARASVGRIRFRLSQWAHDETAYPSSTPHLSGRNTMMPSGMMGGMPMMTIRGHMMKLVRGRRRRRRRRAVLRVVTAIHKRIFDRVDANKDGKVTTDELQAFMRP